jgi:replicative DNA helicase
MERREQELRIEFDSVNEQVVLAAAVVDDDARAKLASLLLPDHFQDKRHRAAWTAMRELVRRGLRYSHETLQKLGKDVDAQYLEQLVVARPEAPPNLEFHVEMLLWDHARITAVQGPVAALLQELRNPLADPERVKSVARQITETLGGYKENQYLRDPGALVAECVAEIRGRREGTASYRYGIDGLDFYETKEKDGTLRRRMIPGPAPGQVTTIIGTPGSGKSTVACRMALGIARQKRRVLYCAWEMNGAASLELMACMSLGWSRSRIQVGRSAKVDLTLLSDEELDELKVRMDQISKWIRFLENPFYRRRREKTTNEQHLDMLQGYISESGADVVVCDLWKRCLRYTKPEDEELALIRQQSMAEELKVHMILVHQLTLKDVEKRMDKHPTRDSAKGSGAWTEVPDNIIGVYRPGLWKGVDDNIIELDVLKQRKGLWPLAIEFDWDGDVGAIEGGRSIEYDAYANNEEKESGVASFFGAGKKGKR